MGRFGVDLFGGVINIIRRPIRQLQIEKEQIKPLLLERGDRLFHSPDHDAAETNLLQKNLEEVLQAYIVIHDQDRRLTGPILLQDILIERIFLDSPPPADLDRRKLATLNQIIDSRQRNSEVFRSLFDCQ